VTAIEPALAVAFGIGCVIGLLAGHAARSLWLRWQRWKNRDQPIPF